MYADLKQRAALNPETPEPQTWDSKRIYRLVVILSALGFAALCLLALNGTLSAFFAK